MEKHYKSAQQISALPADTLKDLYWRKWKANVVVDLDRLAAEITGQLSGISMRGRVCHCSGKRGATIFIESVSAYRKWTESGFARSIAGLPVPAFIPTTAETWEQTKLSPQAAYALLQILLGGLPTLVKVTSQRSNNGGVHMANGKVISVSGSMMPVSTLSLFGLRFIDWVHLPPMDQCNADQLIQNSEYVTEYGTHSFSKSIFGKASDKIQTVGFMCEDIVSRAIFSDIQNRIESLARVRYTIAVAISRHLASHSEIKRILMEYWDGTTEKLFDILADDITRNCLNRVGLRLCCDWTTASVFMTTKVKGFWIETSDRQKWRQLPSAKLRNTYPFGCFDLDAHYHIGYMLEQIMGNGSTVVMNVPQLPQPTLATAYIHTSPAESVWEPVDSPPPSAPPSWAGANAKSPPSPSSAGANAMPPAAPPGYPSLPSQESITLSVNVPPNYPACGDLLGVSFNDEIRYFPIPPGSVPGSQFLVTFA
jgi:hypothetical protein